MHLRKLTFLLVVGGAGSDEAIGGQTTFTDRSGQLWVENRSLSFGGDGKHGVAVFDLDQDDDLDLYIGNGPTQRNALYRAEPDGYKEMAAEANAQLFAGTGGVLAADFNGDGWTDLVLCGDGGNRSGEDNPVVILRNNRNNTFTNVTVQSGMVGPRTHWMASAADIDGDDDLDIFVAASGSQGEYVLHPNKLFRNDEGVFVDISDEAGVGTDLGACVSTFTHVNDDDAIDLVIANCNNPWAVATPFEVYVNDGTGHFQDIAVEAGVWGLGYWMGMAFGDFDGDARMDFYAVNVGTKYGWWPHALYSNLGVGSFQYTDTALEAGVAEHAYGWGAVAEDFDNDGHVDLYYVGAAIRLDPDGDGLRNASPGNLFVNRGDGTFEEPVLPRDLSDLYTTSVAAGDLDGNGFPDLIVTSSRLPSLGAPGRNILLMNDGTANHWLTVRLRGTPGNHAGIGARIRARAGGRTQLREVIAGSSFMATSSPWQTFGLGSEASATLCVHWPDGTREDFGVAAADQRVDLVIGTGKPVADCAQPDGGTDTGDTGTDTDTDTDDTDPPGDSDPDVDDGPRTRNGDPSSCGCATGGSGGAAALLVGGLLLAGRRRGHPAP